MKSKGSGTLCYVSVVRMAADSALIKGNNLVSITSLDQETPLSHRIESFLVYYLSNLVADDLNVPVAWAVLPE